MNRGRFDPWLHRCRKFVLCLSIRFHEYICPDDGRRSFIRKLTITYQITHCHTPIDQSPPRLHVLTAQ